MMKRICVLDGKVSECSGDFTSLDRVATLVKLPNKTSDFVCLGAPGSHIKGTAPKDSTDAVLGAAPVLFSIVLLLLVVVNLPFSFPKLVRLQRFLRRCISRADLSARAPTVAFQTQAQENGQQTVVLVTRVEECDTIEDTQAAFPSAQTATASTAIAEPATKAHTQTANYAPLMYPNLSVNTVGVSAANTTSRTVLVGSQKTLIGGIVVLFAAAAFISTALYVGLQFEDPSTATLTPEFRSSLLHEAYQTFPLQTRFHISAIISGCPASKTSDSATDLDASLDADSDAKSKGQNCSSLFTVTGGPLVGLHCNRKIEKNTPFCHLSWSTGVASLALNYTFTTAVGKWSLLHVSSGLDVAGVSFDKHHTTAHLLDFAHHLAKSKLGRFLFSDYDECLSGAQLASNQAQIHASLRRVNVETTTFANSEKHLRDAVFQGAQFGLLSPPSVTDTGSNSPALVGNIQLQIGVESTVWRAHLPLSPGIIALILIAVLGGVLAVAWLVREFAVSVSQCPCSDIAAELVAFALGAAGLIAAAAGYGELKEHHRAVPAEIESALLVLGIFGGSVWFIALVLLLNRCITRRVHVRDA